MNYWIWRKAISERQAEIEQARIEADQISEREQQARRELEALENRGFIDRVLHRKPVLI